MTIDYLKSLPTFPQRQDSVSEQLVDLVAIANRLGLHDAADAISQLVAKGLASIKYGCHCDLEEGQEPDHCVLDEGRPQDCTYAKPDMRREQCSYWRIVRSVP